MIPSTQARGIAMANLIAAIMIFSLLIVTSGCVSGNNSSPGSPKGDQEYAERDVPVAGGDGDDDGPEDTIEDEQENPVTLRWKIDPDHPFFVFNVYFGVEPEKAANLVALIPDDVRPYFGVQLVGKYPYDDVPEHRQWVEAMVDAFASQGVPTFVQADAFNSRSDMPVSFYESLFFRSPLFLGLVFAELSAAGLTIEGMDDDYVQRIVRAVETVAAHDGFFLWQDMGYEWRGVYDESGHPFVEAGSEPLLFDVFTRFGRHVILQDKHNGGGKRFQGPAAAMGWWSSRLVGAWGVNSEEWLWWEAGWGPLFGENGGVPKAYDSLTARWNFPLAMTGQDWLADLAGCASVFSIEVSYSNGDFSKSTPAFQHVHLPFMRQVIGRRTLLSRQEFLDNVRVAYRPSGPWGYDMHNDDIFKGLYGPEKSSLFEWLPSTGRYFYLPILPTLAGQEIADRYPEVIGTDKWEADWMDAAAVKQAWFNERYPAVTGDSWFVNISKRWFLMNPNENVDIATTFSFPLVNRPCLTLSGTIEPHFFAFIYETDAGFSIRMSNYRIDGQGMLDDFGPEGVFDAYMNDPYDEATRPTLLSLKGLEAGPVITWGGSREFQHRETFSVDTLTMTIDHNGYVEIDIPIQGECQ